METDLTMKTKNEKLRIALLNAGKNEFLAHGYRAVSIRNIATKAGATTGAIYVYFENKEGLFHALVKDTAQELLAFWRQMAAQSTRIVRNGCGYVYQIPCEDKVWLEEFLYKNQTAIHLLLDCSAGTSYENFSHSLIELETAINELAISECMQFQIKQSMDADFIHIISCCFINSVLSIPLRQHTNGRQQYLRILGDYFSFYEAGWKHLLNKAIP